MRRNRARRAAAYGASAWALVLAAGLASISGCGASHDSIAQTIGQPIATWSLYRTLPGGAVDTLLDADLRGKKYVVVLVKATCPACTSEGPSLPILEREYAGRLRMVVASISPDAETEEYARSTGLEKRVYLGAMPLAARFHVRYVPLMLFVGGDGRIAHVIEGSRSIGELRTALDEFAADRRIEIAPVAEHSLLREMLLR
jgi:hypothetical protein